MSEPNKGGGEKTPNFRKPRTPESYGKRERREQLGLVELVEKGTNFLSFFFIIIFNSSPWVHICRVYSGSVV